MLIYNLAVWCVWLQNLFSHIKGRALVGGVLKNRLLRKVFGPKREEVTGNWGKLHIEEFHELHSLPDIQVINHGK